MFLGKRISVVIPCHNEEEGVRAVMKSSFSVTSTCTSSGIEFGGYVPSPSIVTMMSPLAAA